MRVEPEEWETGGDRPGEGNRSGEWVTTRGEGKEREEWEGEWEHDQGETSSTTMRVDETCRG